MERVKYHVPDSWFYLTPVPLRHQALQITTLEKVCRAGAVAHKPRSLGLRFPVQAPTKAWLGRASGCGGLWCVLRCAGSGSAPGARWYPQTRTERSWLSGSI